MPIEIIVPVLQNGCPKNEAMLGKRKKFHVFRKTNLSFSAIAR